MSESVLMVIGEFLIIFSVNLVSTTDSRAFLKTVVDNGAKIFQSNRNREFCISFICSFKGLFSFKQSPNFCLLTQLRRVWYIKNPLLA